MKDILSQAQIDDLIKNMGSEEQAVVVPKKEKVKVYDFKKPNKFTREQIRVFEDIYGNFAKILSLKLSDRLRTNCFLDLTYIDEQTFFEYTGNISIEFSNIIVYSIINLMLGGRGGEDADFNGYTDIELNLIKRVLKMFSQPIENIWSKYTKLDVELGRLENMGQHIQIAAPSDVIAIITMKIEIAEKEGLINFCVPYLLVEPILKELDTKLVYKKALKENLKSFEDEMKESILEKHAEVTCRLGNAFLSMEDLRKIQPGDVIKLKKQKGERAEILINSIPKYLGDIGVKNKKYAIKIQSIIEGID